MINLSQLLAHGLILSIMFSVFVISTLVWKPRLWLQDFPADIQALIPPKTQIEKRQTLWLGAAFVVILFGGLGAAAVDYGSDHGIFGMFIHVYLVWQIVNLIDLIVIDWGGMHLVDPNNPPFPGTEGAKGYRDYRFHFVGFVKGSLMGVVLAAVITLITWALIATG